MATTLISGGTVVNATGTGAADVLIDGEKIAAVLQPGSTLLGHDLAASVDTVVDATGKYVIPGGIDAHTHMQMPFGGTEASDTFETGTRAAAIGGTTSIVDFVVQYPDENILDRYQAWHDKAAGQCAIDYGFHQILSDVQDSSLTAMDELIAEGVTSFKLFMAYKGVFLSDDGQILRAFQKGADNGAMMMMHAENGAIIDVLVQQALARGETSPYFHGTTRPWQAEEEATHRAIMLADLTGARCTSCTSARSRRSNRSPRRATAVSTCSARPARSTSISRSKTSSAPRAPSGATSRARSGCARRRCARSTRATSTTCGSRCARTTSRWCRPTTAPSA